MRIRWRVWLPLGNAAIDLLLLIATVHVVDSWRSTLRHPWPLWNQRYGPVDRDFLRDADGPPMPAPLQAIMAAELPVAFATSLSADAVFANGWLSWKVSTPFDFRLVGLHLCLAAVFWYAVGRGLEIGGRRWGMLAVWYVAARLLTIPASWTAWVNNWWNLCCLLFILAWIVLLAAVTWKGVRWMIRRHVSVAHSGAFGISALVCLLCGNGVARAQSAVPPTGAMVVGLRETAKHRLSPPVVRYGAGSAVSAYLWLHVDPEGRVASVQNIDGGELSGPELGSAARKIRYRPFLRDGVPVHAWVQEEFQVIASEERPRKTVPFPKITDPSRVSIQLSRSGCFGSCPSYTVTLGGDGKVSYVGHGSVSIAGAQIAHVDPSKIVALVDRFRQANFFGLKDRYWYGITDSPTYCISIRIGGRVKAIEDYVGERAGMPSVVSELEDAVDATAETSRWVTSGPATLEAMRQAGIGLKSPQAAQILRTAVYMGDLFTVRNLLAAGTPIGAVTSSPESVFDWPPAGSLPELAVASRNEPARLPVLQAVLAAPRVADSDSLQKALAIAVESGDVDLAVTLLHVGADPAVRMGERYSQQQRDKTYLMLAAASGVWAMIDDALSRPNDIRAVDSDGRTALVHLVYSAPPVEDIFPLVDRLLAAGADRSELDRILLDTCHPNWIPGLIARGGNVNARDAKGNTPLFQSCTVEGVQALLDFGADPTLRNHAGLTAIEATFPPERGREDSRAAAIRRFIESHRPPKE